MTRFSTPSGGTSWIRFATSGAGTVWEAGVDTHHRRSPAAAMLALGVQIGMASTDRMVSILHSFT
jgi:hypothetical protein